MGIQGGGRTIGVSRLAIQGRGVDRRLVGDEGWRLELRLVEGL